MAAAGTTDIIAAKRRGLHHTPEDIRRLISGFVSGDIADYQMSAWLMAVCINGLDPAETFALTEAMIASGGTVDLSGLPGITVDKHSTGGIGDKTTLVLVPLLASAGLTVAKMSGRGLGITGGTIDKLESIPGFRTDLTRDEFLDQASRVGCAVAGQTADLVPADKKIYALRDVTATIDSIPLIASSVMSKKIASGASTILLDVKVGSGAFMRELDDARELARAMIELGSRAGRKTVAAITAMNQPLGLAVGNTVEVIESMEVLSGRGPSDLRDLCIRLSSMLHSKAADSPPAVSRALMREGLDSGAAMAKFREWIAAQGGDVDALPEPAWSRSVLAESSGIVQSVDAGMIGKAAGLLGAGRQKKEDSIDPTAGVALHRKIGDEVDVDDELAVIFGSREIDGEPAMDLVRSAFVTGPEAADAGPLIIETIGF